MCQACSEGRHWDCGCQTWCECDCDPTTAMVDAAISGDGDPDEEPDDHEPERDDYDEEGCLFPGECCMPGPHYKHECHTPDMLPDVANSAIHANPPRDAGRERGREG